MAKGKHSTTVIDQWLTSCIHTNNIAASLTLRSPSSPVETCHPESGPGCAILSNLSSAEQIGVLVMILSAATRRLYSDHFGSTLIEDFTISVSLQCVGLGQNNHLNSDNTGGGDTYDQTLTASTSFCSSTTDPTVRVDLAPAPTQ